MQIRGDNLRMLPTNSVSSTSGSASTSANGAAGSSKVQVSGGAQRLAEVSKAVEGADEVRADKVAALKAQVDSGTYQPNLEGLADLLAQKLS